MKKTPKLLSVLLILLSILIVSCRQEESEFVEASPEETLKANSNVANLLLRTSMNDGSDDNIIDNASCFSIELPVTVNVDGLEIIVDSEEDFDTIEDIFDEFDDDDDDLEIFFPITIVLADFTEVTINSLDEFENFSDDCDGENIEDDDIECADIQYPVSTSIFDINNELIGTLNINNDQELYNFIDDLEDTDIVNIGFPIVVILSDGTEVEAFNLDQLEDILDDAKDDCDEDDDNDFDDDDCENCSTDQLADVLTGCDNWMVDKLERNDNDLEDLYVGYQFNFMADGTLSATSISDTFPGTWESSGSGQGISVTINIPNLPDFNDTWNLHEIEQQSTENQVDLRIGDDRLRFESDCTNNGDGNGGDNMGMLGTILQDGLWTVASYLDDGIDETNDYDGYELNFNNDGTVTADNGTPINGDWSLQNSESSLILNFGTSMPFDEFNGDWDVIASSDTSVELRDVSGGGGGTDTLILEKL